MHNANIIHADLKPANFLLVAGQLKVIDFGMAMDLVAGNDFVLRKNLGGTKEYLSPECLANYVFEDGVITIEESAKAAGVKLSTKSDVWALGVILYQAVYGSLPFSSVPGGKVAKLRCLADPDIAVEFEKVKNLDPLLLDTMTKCLNKCPEKRATIEELLNHPYLRPNHEALEDPMARTCTVCKSRDKHIYRMTNKRLNRQVSDY